MKVLLVAPQPFYSERGTPIAVRLLVETLCEFGHQVDLLVYHDGEDIEVPGMRLLRAWRPPGVRQVPIGISWQKLACDALLVLSMIGLLLRNRYDVVHAVEESVFPAAAFGVLSKRKLVYDMDSSLSEQLVDKWTPLRPLATVFRWLERAAVRRSAVVLPVCEDLAHKVRPWTDAGRVTVLPDVPMGDSNPPGFCESLRDLVGPRSVIGLYVGNLERYQGIDLLVEGLAAMSKDVDFCMVVIGGSPGDVTRYRQRTQELGIADRVSLLGPRPLAYLNAYLEQADVLVSPRTMGQNTPMKVYSYMQSGKAILATDIRSHTQALDATCAELVPPEPEAVARGLERLARDEPRRRQLGSAARLKAESEYSLDAYRARLRRAYDQLVAG
jgi:glycosyltransferase involved in cell wall biosynthesis